jgi:hypothetical protein
LSRPLFARQGSSWTSTFVAVMMARVTRYRHSGAKREFSFTTSLSRDDLPGKLVGIARHS